jgi:hypothetical protein
VNPVSEELLNRAIRANVELAQALSQLVREVGEGLRTIHNHVGRLAAPRDEAQRAQATTALEAELWRLQRLLRDVGQPGASRPGSSRAPGPPQVPPTPPRGMTVAPGPPRPPAVAAPAPAPPPRPAPAPPVPAAAPAATASLDLLLADVAQALRPALQARPVALESRIARGAALPSCAPASLRRALLGLLQGLAAVEAPQTAIALRAEKKPVVMRSRDGTESRRDFVMLAATHAGGLADADQQRILRGGDPGPLGEAYRLVREMGGFLRFAPLPGGALETRVFVPAG